MTSRPWSQTDTCHDTYVPQYKGAITRNQIIMDSQSKTQAEALKAIVKHHGNTAQLQRHFPGDMDGRRSMAH